ncbi:MAG: hypothetical protein SFZ02_11565 [bacterium]|nr:hypothetical protein [bacterium]
MAFAPVDTLFDDILEFLASSPSPEAIINYHPPENLQSRLSELIEKNRKSQISSHEQIELDEFLRMNRFMNRLRIKARQRLSA